MEEVRIDREMSLSVTRCPHCGSTFNISRRQLESSGGQARCGACLRVFPALDNLVEPGESTDSTDSVFVGRSPEIENAFEVLPEDDRDIGRPAHAPATTAQEAANDEPPAPPEIESRFEALPEDGRAALKQFRSTVQLRKRKYFDWAAFFGYSTLALSLLALLAAQYLWRYLPVYSQVDWLRPGYAQLCALAGCELPVYSRSSSIRNDNTVLGAHPDYPDAYVLAARFHNAAPFPQPFPVVVLRFTSLDARTVALREFSPSEYLHPDLLALGLMPPNSPVQIELELMNPGPEAVNYEVSFRAP